MNSVSIPIIDISGIDRPETSKSIAENIAKACREHGFFYIAGHGVPLELQERIYDLSKAFFALSEEEKMKISMQKGGKAWRGYFPLHGELTSGIPDRKEGIYFGTELSEKDKRVKTGLPLHGKNLFPENPPELKKVVLEYIDAVTNVGHQVMKGISLSLGLDGDYFYKKYNRDPLILFRIFHYTAQEFHQQEWGVGEHTDYGLLTILLQDSVGGLQVKSKGEWIDAPPVENTFVCNIGDMLDKMTGGVYRSTPHRVLNKSGIDRLSFPLFFDPGFDTIIEKVEHINAGDISQAEKRWDNANVHEFGGTYGEYLINKISKVFPELKDDVL